ncbi:fertility inhibition FinO-like protein [uncultured Nostoc sp.]|uniref:fertility inhibition FinO-like protein n=1 Tax=uncultured Nostoc sp. TaxID=340711 RepID=UPI0035CBE549
MLTEVAMIAGKLEITIKINELPQPKTIENGWQQFDLECDGRIITITVKPKIYKKLTDAASNYPQWVAAMSNDKPRSVYAGKLGQQTDNGFVLEEPNIQVFERKPKAERTSAFGAVS